MSYIITAFDGLTLDEKCNGAEDVGGGEVAARCVTMAGGGLYDAWGGETAPRGLTTIAKKGDVVSTSAANFRTALNAIKAKIGKRGVLWRQWDDGTEEWCIARLTGESSSRTPGNILDLPVDLTFTMVSPVWYGKTINTVSGSFAGASATLSLPNDGNAPVANAVITLTSPASAPATITSLVVSKSGQTYFTWSGSLAAGQSLVIDCGAKSVKRAGINAYALVFSTSHTISDWLRLDPGANSVTFTVSPLGAVPIDGAAGMWMGLRTVPTYAAEYVPTADLGVSVSYYDGWM